MRHHEAFFDAYIHESKHPDCLPERRFRAVMPSGVSEWFATRDEATAAIATEVANRTRTAVMSDIYPEYAFDHFVLEHGPTVAAHEAFGRWMNWRRELDDDGRDSSLDMIDEWADSDAVNRPKAHVYPVRVHGAK